MLEIDLRIRVKEIIGEESSFDEDDNYVIHTDDDFHASNEERQEIIDAVTKTLSMTTFFTGVNVPRESGGAERYYVVSISHARDNIGVL